ncbi:putative alcohol dehydrogenase [Helianthus anomalus]
MTSFILVAKFVTIWFWLLIWGLMGLIPYFCNRFYRLYITNAFCEVYWCQRFGKTILILYITWSGIGCRMVESIGEDVGMLVRPGNVVIPLYLGECGECLNCKSGKINICHVHPNTLIGLMRDDTSRMSRVTDGECKTRALSVLNYVSYCVLSDYALRV